jgi:hypothetical protein
MLRTGCALVLALGSLAVADELGISIAASTPADADLAQVMSQTIAANLGQLINREGAHDTRSAYG